MPLVIQPIGYHSKNQSLKQGETWLDLNFQQKYGHRNEFVMITQLIRLEEIT